MNPLDVLAADVPHLQESLNSVYIFGNSEFGLTQFTFWMMIAFAVTLIIVLICSRKLTMVPKNKFVHMVEYGYDFVRKDMGESTIGHGYKKHVPFLATMFFFILVCNFIGLIPGAGAATGTLSATWALALISFVYFVFYGVKSHGVFGYLKSLCPSGLPLPFVPFIWFLELVSTVIRLLTLAVRLYGNMFAGHMVLGIFALATGVFMTTAIQNMDFLVGLPSIAWFALLFAMYALETLVAFLQAYIFTVLSAVYIQLATSSH